MEEITAFKPAATLKRVDTLKRSMVAVYDVSPNPTVLSSTIDALVGKCSTCLLVNGYGYMVETVHKVCPDVIPKALLMLKRKAAQGPEELSEYETRLQKIHCCLDHPIPKRSKD